jgi:hypothetical protein
LKQAREGKLPPAIFVELFNRAYGKVKDTVALETPRPLVVSLLERAERADPDIDAGAAR